MEHRILYCQTSILALQEIERCRPLLSQKCHFEPGAQIETSSWIEKLKEQVGTTILCPLQTVPTILPTGTVIGALGVRSLDYMILLKNEIAINEALGLADGDEVYVELEVHARQLDLLRPGLRIKTSGFLKPDMRTSMLRSAEDGSDELRENSTRFHPSEVTPPVGAGVMAYICDADDLSTRRLLRDLHVTDTSQCTNQERKLKKLLGPSAENNLVAHCSQDRAGNYRFYASLWTGVELVTISKTHSTFADLAADSCSEFQSRLK